MLVLSYKLAKRIILCSVYICFFLGKYYKGVDSYDYLDDKHKLRVLYADGDKELPDLCKKLWKMLDEILPNWPNLDNFSISCFVVKRASFFLPLGC
ncbi:hypothetical protein HanRHA438_Chr07g0299631 [Helianthus annuus]|nr:hypothetical protein HanHA300_Chr07g0237611 [Helianthus annuus]KAJ0556268.1 hypothetical protein HanIR_Chr07g0311821 [Helianthus annuus]KAJ0562714.1 hypothetical protein HanHA89_Chr07g0254781 [Helianthus annuus]KAJ0728091.1 hypothetical protein HanLR1_Chr07g0237561 [Helianthus annuus]KAJ0730866.1 hypothetical protein HanOQP8_Chr07g0245281 [Helianthus annuus]